MRSQRLIAALLGQAGIKIDGADPWDIRVDDERFYDLVVKKGAVGLGDSYVLGYWDCEDIPEMSNKLSRTVRYQMPRGFGIVENQRITEEDLRGCFRTLRSGILPGIF